MTDVLIIRPESDPVEQTLSVWCDLTFPPGVSTSGTVTLTDLRGPAATATAVQTAVSNGDVIVYFGHGTETSLGDATTLLDTVTVAGAAGQVMIAVACKSAGTFGPAAVSGGHLAAFLGFSDLLFVYNGSPAVIGYQVATRIDDHLNAGITLGQTGADLIDDLKDLEDLYRTGAQSHHIDAVMIWMGSHINWRGIDWTP